MQWKTGRVAWRARSVGKGTVAYADSHLYLASEDGIVGLAQATPAGYREKSRFRISRSSVPLRTVPVIFRWPALPSRPGHPLLLRHQPLAVTGSGQ